MSIFAALISLANLVVVDVTGMPPQITRVLAVSKLEGWAVVCRGHAGEETVLRLQLPRDITQEKAALAFGGRDSFVSSMNFVYDPKDVTRNCDREPVKVESSSSASILALGPEVSLRKLIGLAKSCGFTKAALRELRPSEPLIPASAIRPGWKVLDAGEDTVARYGPAICFVELRRSALAQPSPAN